MISHELRAVELARQDARRAHAEAELASIERPDPWRVRPPAERRPPEIVLRLAEASEVPPTALTAQRRLQAAGWAVWPTYCRGLASTGKLVDSLALRCDRLAIHRSGRPVVLQAIGIWHDGYWDHGWVGGPWKMHGQRAWLAVLTDECHGWLVRYGLRIAT